MIGSRTAVVGPVVSGMFRPVGTVSDEQFSMER